MDDFGAKESHKPHRERHAGRKTSKKKQKDGVKEEQNPRQRNPKAFAIQSAVKAERRFRRTMDIKSKRQQLPSVDRTPVEPPPVVVAIVGPPMVGKTTLLRCLIKNFTRQNLSNIQGPVTVVSGKKRRLTFIECNNDINVMIDVAKIADLVLLLIDAKFGFEMETFEFLNICQVHGFPRILGVLTHLDLFKNNKQQRITKKQLKHRFWTEIYQGAKLFYLSGMIHDEYQKTEVKNLGRFISVMKFRPLQWRNVHPYLVADRMEDVTDPEMIRQSVTCNRNVCFYGFTRGTHLKAGSSIHIPGAGDFSIADVTLLPDPCPLPDREKRRSLNEKERLIYAPMSGVGGIVYDKDAVYIELGGSHSHHAASTNFDDAEKQEPSSELMSSIINTQHTINSKIAASQVQLFSSANPIASHEVYEDKNESLAHLLSEESTTDDSCRKRRKVIFSDAEKITAEDDDSSDESTDNDDQDEECSGEESEENEEQSHNASDEENNEPIPKKVHFISAGDISSYSESDQETGELRWKQDLYKKAADTFYKHQEVTSNLQKLVYGKLVDTANDGDAETEIDELFRYAKKKNQDQQKNRITINQEESSKFILDSMQDWNAEAAKEKIRDCFVTGKWKESEDAEALLQQNSESDEEMFGDFEDLETGQVHGASKSESNIEEVDGSQKEAKQLESEENAVDKRREKKRKLKEMFDTEYDEKDGGTSYYDELKAEMDQQTQLNKSEFEDLDDDLRVQYEGFRPGMYVRVQVSNVPCELVTNFDASYPLILGGLAAVEDNIGFVQVRLKKHRWYPKILKTRDPLILSLGWRRFQTVVLFSMQDHNGRNRLLKYTPEHLHCMASFWGPITPQNSGFVAIQNVAENTPNFRIAATGVVLDLDKSTQIAKKLKLTGIPTKIYKKTAFIKGMFNSALEVGKYEGASIRTVSGIRGQIKKALRSPEGSFRATFEDKLLMSDIVFLRTWFVVEVPRFYNPVTSLLLHADQKAKWKGMRTVGQLRKEKGIKPPTNSDSQYRPITRQPRIFNPLSVPRALQRDLPYKDKPKFIPRKPTRSLEKQRIAVVREPHEQKVARLMKRVKTLYSHRQVKEKEAMAKRVDAHRAEQAKIEAKRLRRQKEVKRDICRVLNKLEQKKQRQQGNPKYRHGKT